MNQRRGLKLGVAAGLIVLAAALWMFAGRADDDAQPLVAATPRAGQRAALWPVPAFSFPDQNNQTISKQSLLGKVWIASFLETECKFVCPKMAAKIGKLQQELNDPRVEFIAFSIDPDNDKLAARAAYAEKHKIDPARWHFLAPPDRDTALRIAHAVKVAGKPDQREFTAIHQDRFVLIDDQGRARGSYPAPDPAAMTQLANDVQALLRDVSAVAH